MNDEEKIIRAKKTLSTLMGLCKYHQIGIDQDHIAHSTCRYEENIPTGKSWGICSIDNCPFIGEEVDDG